MEQNKEDRTNISRKFRQDRGELCVVAFARRQDTGMIKGCEVT